MASHDLLPCAHCSGKPGRFGRMHALVFGVSCCACGSRVYGKSREEADTKWNTRTTEKALKELIEAVDVREGGDLPSHEADAILQDALTRARAAILKAQQGGE